MNPKNYMRFLTAGLAEFSLGLKTDTRGYIYVVEYVKTRQSYQFFNVYLGTHRPDLEEPNIKYKAQIGTLRVFRCAEGEDVFFFSGAGAVTPSAKGHPSFMMFQRFVSMWNKHRKQARATFILRHMNYCGRCHTPLMGKRPKISGLGAHCLHRVGQYGPGKYSCSNPPPVELDDTLPPPKQELRDGNYVTTTNDGSNSKDKSLHIFEGFIVT